MADVINGSEILVCLTEKEAGILATILDLIEFSGKNQVARFAQDLQEQLFDATDDAAVDLMYTLQDHNDGVDWASVTILFPKND